MALPPLVEPAEKLTIDEVRRYSRHLIIPDVGMDGQKRLKNARVLVIGAGGAAHELVVGDNTWQIAGNPQAVEDVRAALLKP